MSGEPLPLFGERPHRIGILAEKLASKGHDVTWWTTTFDHQHKKYLYNKNTSIHITPSYKINFVHGSIPYKKNISITRLINHYQVSKAFKKNTNEEQRPDIILCAYPTIDLAYEAVRYANKNNIPIVIDVRDLWPDIFIDPLPNSLKKIGELALSLYIKKANYIFNHCTSIIAVSDSYLLWTQKYKLNSSESVLDKIFPLGYKKPDPIKNVIIENKFSYINFSPSINYVLFSGTFGQTYDLSTIIKSAAMLKDNKKVHFIFVGDGENTYKWKTEAHGLNNITFTGWVNNDELSYLLSKSDIGLMAYKINAPQSLPNKIFEYLAYGMPIVSSLDTDTKHLLFSKNIGITYTAGDPIDFKKKLLKILNDDNILSEMKKNAQILFNESYSSDNIYDNLVIYLEETHQFFGEKYDK